MRKPSHNNYEIFKTVFGPLLNARFYQMPDSGGLNFSISWEIQPHSLMSPQALFDRCLEIAESLRPVKLARAETKQWKDRLESTLATGRPYRRRIYLLRREMKRARA